ncbi:3-isopropylmalate dehydratase small subunit [Solidesulfovibrio sp.]|uniref:3-isopropylmalate dehydratase small subunit n=1 Tax=Solidesulfovibrio sp. TaxID=2910990 RepID=UPI0026213591|nr:3-isopropylmalate dehydratase small subunit [Solidesulfovibrio sp.]
MQTTITGKAFVYGANVDTDQIYPGRFLDLTDPEDVARHAMEGADPLFASQCAPGDVVVAATNFGCGSSREHAVVTLKAAGVGAILAESFGRIFFRNAINLGLPAIVCPGVQEAVARGDVVSVDIAAGTVANKTTGATLTAQPLSDYVMNILRNGGIKPMIRKSLGL